MSGIGDWIRLIRTFGIRRKMYKEKSCRFDGRSYINYSNCKFEGYNSVGKFSILNQCVLGYASYISESTCLVKTSVGRFCSIGPHVHIINGRHPTQKFASIHPAFYSVGRQAGFTYVERNKFDEFRYADIKKEHFVKIGNDVWIGDGASIIDGVTIADGTIVAAGAVVVKNTEPYSIVGGNPAKTIRYRYKPEEIDFLLDLKWWNRDREWIQDHAEYFEDIKLLRQIIGGEKQQ